MIHQFCPFWGKGMCIRIQSIKHELRADFSRSQFKTRTLESSGLFNVHPKI